MTPAKAREEHTLDIYSKVEGNCVLRSNFDIVIIR